MNTKILVSAMLLGLASVSADAALYSRLGGQAYYDDTLNVTWMQDAGLAASNTFGVSGINAQGLMSWNTAQSWIAAMNSANYLGVESWRLPNMIDINSDGCQDNFARQNTDCGYNAVSVGPNASEMASMFYDTLDNLPIGHQRPIPVYSRVMCHSCHSSASRTPARSLAWARLVPLTNCSGMGRKPPAIFRILISPRRTMPGISGHLPVASGSSERAC